jgi:hypothetical protein
MKPPSARKEELLAVCDIQRQMLQLEWGLVQVHVQRIQATCCRKIPAACKWLAPVLGFLIARRLRGARAPRSVNWAPAKVLILYKLWQGWRWWRRCSGH